MEHKHAVNAKYNSEEWIGKKYGKLTVIGYEKHVRKNGEKSWYWSVRCDCGNEKNISVCNLLDATIVSFAKGPSTNKGAIHETVS